MLNDPMQNGARPNPALPDSLRLAVREAQAAGRAAEDRAQSSMPFRARLRARDAVRPQPTLSILTHSGPITAGPVSHYAISEVRVLRRQPVPNRPATKAPLVPVAATAGGIAVIVQGGKTGGSGDDGDDNRAGLLSRAGDFSQFAFAGLAVLGLAGLSVMAAEDALGGKPDAGDAEDGADFSAASSGISPFTANVSAAAVQQVSEPAGTVAAPWFDYRGTADLLKARVAEMEAADAETARLASAEADRTAASAIANAEAARVAAQQPGAPSGPAIIDNRVRDRLAAEEAARAAASAAAVQLRTEQAGAAARLEADRIAAEEAARAAAAAADQQRLAQVEAQRIADAEAARLAGLAAKKQAADAEAERLARAEAEKAERTAEAKRAADIEARRLASLEAKRASDEAEAARQAALGSRRLADAQAARLATAASPAPAPARIWTNPPGRASLKPERPAQVRLAAVPVERTAPPSLGAGAPQVRQLANFLRPVDDFIAERAEYTAGRALDAAALGMLKSDFIKLVEGSADGTHHELLTPDGRPLLIHLERTVPVDPVTARNQAIGYRPAAEGFVTRTYSQPAGISVSVMCRYVSYAFPGRERGRFAACERSDGTWTMARASTANAAPI